MVNKGLSYALSEALGIWGSGGQERASDSTSLAWQRGEWLDLTPGQGAVALLEVSFISFPRCVAWEPWVWEPWEWLAAWGGLLEAGWGQPLQVLRGKKIYQWQNVIELLSAAEL